MYCPVCQDEFREGFTRCEDCDAELVADLAAAPPPPRPSAAPAADPDREPIPIDMADYCGFISLEDAREARDLLRSSRILSEIVIREAPGGDPEGELVEDFWIRVDRKRIREAQALLDADDDGGPEADSGGDDPFRL